jgi:hypothetical protein
MMDGQAYLGTLYQEQGQRLFGDGDYRGAIEMLEQARMYTPPGADRERVGHKYHEALNHLAQQLAHAERWSEARPVVKKALEILPGCRNCSELLAEIKRELDGPPLSRYKLRKK